MCAAQSQGRFVLFWQCVLFPLISRELRCILLNSIEPRVAEELICPERSAKRADEGVSWSGG